MRTKIYALSFIRIYHAILINRDCPSHLEEDGAVFCRRMAWGLDLDCHADGLLLCMGVRGDG